MQVLKVREWPASGREVGHKSMFAIRHQECLFLQVAIVAYFGLVGGGYTVHIPDLHIRSQNGRTSAAAELICLYL